MSLRGYGIKSAKNRCWFFPSSRKDSPKRMNYQKTTFPIFPWNTEEEAEAAMREITVKKRYNAEDMLIVCVEDYYKCWFHGERTVIVNRRRI